MAFGVGAAAVAAACSSPLPPCVTTSAITAATATTAPPIHSGRVRARGVASATTSIAGAIAESVRGGAAPSTRESVRGGAASGNDIGVCAIGDGVTPPTRSDGRGSSAGRAATWVRHGSGRTP